MRNHSHFHLNKVPIQTSRLFDDFSLSFILHKNQHTESFEFFLFFLSKDSSIYLSHYFPSHCKTYSLCYHSCVPQHSLPSVFPRMIISAHFLSNYCGCFIAVISQHHHRRQILLNILQASKLKRRKWRQSPNITMVRRAEFECDWL